MFLEKFILNNDAFKDTKVYKLNKDQIQIKKIEESEAVEFVYSLGIDIDNDVRYSAMGDVNVSRLH